FHLLTDGLAQGGNILEAEALGKIVVQLARVGTVDMEHIDVEYGVSTGQLGVLVILGESHLHFAGVALFGADKLLLEAGNEFTRAHGQVRMVGRATIELLAVDLAHEGEAEIVAILDDPIVSLAGIAAVLGE